MNDLSPAEKLNPIAAFAGYFILGAVLLRLYDPKFFPQGLGSPLLVALLFFMIAGFTLVPWLSARYVVNCLPPLSRQDIALAALTVSSGGFALALFTSLVGNAPGAICHTVQVLHALVTALACLAFWRASRLKTNGLWPLFWCGILYFISGWLMAPLNSSLQCGPSCSATGWKLLGLGLFDLNIIVSVFMGFFVIIATLRAKQRAAN